MTAISHGALRLFFASSAVTVNLLSKFEPALAHVANRNLIRNEDKKQNKLKQGHVLFPNRRKQERKRVTSVVVDETFDPVSGSLQNIKPQGHQKTNFTENIVSTECDPDVGILTCGEGEHCMRRPTTNGGVGGVCVPTSYVPPPEDDEMKANEIGSTLEHYAAPQTIFLHQRKQRKLQEVDCDQLLEVAVDVYIAEDIYSNGYVNSTGAVENENFWSAFSEFGTPIVSYTSFPYEAPVEGTYCFPLGEVIELNIYDTQNDGIDAEDSVAGLALNINGVADFFIFELPGFFTLGVIAFCFECSAYDTCDEVVCPTDAPTGAPTAAPTPTSPTTPMPTTPMPTTAPPTAAGPTTSPSAAPSPLPTVSPAPTSISASKSSKKSSKSSSSKSPAASSGKGSGKGSGSTRSPGFTSSPGSGKGSKKLYGLFSESRR